MRRKLMNRTTLLIGLCMVYMFATADARVYCQCGSSYFYVKGGTCDVCSAGTSAQYAFGNNNDKAEYKLVAANDACHSSTTFTSPATKAKFLSCWDHLGYFRDTLYYGSGDYFQYASHHPPTDAACTIAKYFVNPSSQSKPTHNTSGGHNMLYFAGGSCTLQYIQVAGDDKLLGFKANVTQKGTLTRSSVTGASCATAGSVEDICTRVYTVEYLGTNKDRMVMHPQYYDCYTQHCQLDTLKTKCSGADLVTDITFDIKASADKSKVIVSNSGCIAEYAVTDGEILEVKPTNALSSAKILFGNVHQLAFVTTMAVFCVIDMWIV